MTSALAILFCTALGVSDPSVVAVQPAAATQIYANGGKELLEGVFRAMEHILYGGGNSGIQSTFKVLIRLALTIGAFCAVCLAFFRQKFEPLIRSFFLPGIAIISLLLVPRTSVEICDDQDCSSKAIEIPFFVGKFAGLTSRAIHKLQTIFSNACNTYPWVKSLYEEKNFFRHKAISLQVPQLENNTREYCRECIFRDLGLGLYTKKDLSKSPNLLEFLEKNSSAKRMMLYQDEQGSNWISCKRAIGKIKKQIEEKAEILGPSIEIPSLLELGSEKDARKQLIEQKIVIDLLNKERNESRNLASLGAFSLIASHYFFEALLYLAFPLIVLLSLLSFGLRIMITWIKLLLWVSLWPILYVIVDLFLASLWNVHSKTFGSTTGLTLEKALKYTNLYGTMEVVACIVLLCVPVLSWLLIQGGSSQVSQLTANLFQPTPVQIAPTSGKQEQTIASPSQGIGDIKQTYTQMSQRNDTD